MPRDGVSGEEPRGYCLLCRVNIVDMKLSLDEKLINRMAKIRNMHKTTRFGTAIRRHVISIPQ